MTAIDDKHAALGGEDGFLGPPIGPEQAVTVANFTLPNAPRFRDYQGGTIWWSQQTGAHEVHGLIRQKWMALGGWMSKLGLPKTDETDTVSGRYNQFQRGVVLWKSGATEAFEVRGAIHRRYVRLGSEKGFLEYPVTDELGTPDGIGRFNHFENGSIYWKPTTGAHEVHGLIRKLWAERGWETDAGTGFPISNELPVADGSPHRFSDFEDGVIVWVSGEPAARLGTKHPIASKPADEIFAAMADEVEKILTSADEKIYITRGPSAAGLPIAEPPGGDPGGVFAITDYEQRASGIRNRKHQIAVDFGYEVSGTNDPDFTLTFTIELRFHRPSRKVQALLRRVHTYVELDWPTNWFSSPEDAIAQIEAEIEPYLGEPIEIAEIPEAFNVLSLKVMRNGDMNVYIWS